MIMDRFQYIRLFGILATVGLVGNTPLQAADKLEYNRDIRPILAENCFACHGPDSAARKANLRLDKREEALKKEAFVPGKPDESALVEHIMATKANKVMPPPTTNKTLTAAQKETLKKWIAQGAEYQLHWSLIAPKRPTPPTVKNPSWVRNPIDNFILADLEKNGLQPAPESDRRALARRLSFDLVGLPPDPADVEEMVKDPAANWYEKYVDKLLKMPQWGEHRGRYWLDAARYADSHGIHFDNYREIWSYRDWVINAFNQNMKFDQFTIEQLAGDLLPNPSIDQLVATGFNRCNITTNEGGAIDEEYLVLYARDRTETVSQVWMGTTAGCAVCHDHKFDPITTRDFYSLSALFNNTTQRAMDGNIPNTPPVITLPKPEDRPRWDQINKELSGLRAKLETRKKEAKTDFDSWLKTAKSETIAAMTPSEGLKFHAKLSEGEGKTLHYTFDGKAKDLKVEAGLDWVAGKVAAKAFTQKIGSTIELPEVGDFEKNQAFSVTGWIRTGRTAQTGSIIARMDDGKDFRGWDIWLEADRIGIHIVNKWPTDALKVVSKQTIQPNQWHQFTVTYDGSGKAAGIKIYVNGLIQAADTQADVLKNTIKTTVPLKIGQRHTTSRIASLTLQDLRIYERSLGAAQAEQLAKSARAAELIAKPADKKTAKEVDELMEYWLVTLDKPTQELSGKIGAAQQEEANLKARGTVAYVMSERPGEPIAHILFRGEYDKRRDQVKADTPKALPPLPSDLPRNRLGFAKWLLRAEHPLTARVTANRFWQELFGTGIVRTAGDFGVTGELPTHPELLDWLATEFQQSWDTKQFFKLIVTSATYRQAPITTKEKMERDPHNRLLSRGPRYRMDAEMIRDNALAASGLLVRKLGGPSVRPYQPPGVWEAVAMIGSNTRDYRQDTGDNLYRRSMYTFWKRAAPPASMDILNAPSRETCTVRRERTNTPLQALVTLNDPQYIEAARVLAQKTIKEGGVRDEEKIDFIARRLLSRPMRPEEMKVCQESLAELLASYKTKLQDAQKLIAVGESKADATIDPTILAGWTMFINELMNLDEVLNK
jgi:mono/diheme cytochrome c family protein